MSVAVSALGGDPPTTAARARRRSAAAAFAPRHRPSSSELKPISQLTLEIGCADVMPGSKMTAVAMDAEVGGHGAKGVGAPQGEARGTSPREASASSGVAMQLATHGCPASEAPGGPVASDAPNDPGQAGVATRDQAGQGFVRLRIACGRTCTRHGPDRQHRWGPCARGGVLALVRSQASATSLHGRLLQSMTVDWRRRR